MALVSPVNIRRIIPIEAYRPYEQPGREIASFLQRGHALAESLGSHKVWMLNSTETGGGVAEILQRLCSLLNDLGIDTRWLVLKPHRADFFPITKALHNMLHGEPSEHSLEECQRVYDEVSRAAAEDLRAVVNRSDVLIVHDPQPLGVARYISEVHRPHLLWRCHIGVPEASEVRDRAWRFLSPYLEPYPRLLFSAEQYIPDEFFDRSGVLSPGIDPLNHKNRGFSLYKAAGILRATGLLDGPETPPWARFEATAERFSGREWVRTPIPNLLFTPTIVQISRFDRLKGFEQLLEGFIRLIHPHDTDLERLKLNTERALSELSMVQLILAGADPGGIADDPEGLAVLQGLTRRISALEPGVARRIHLVRLPMVDFRQNALMVNALQRVANVVVQCSLKEGFGLTATEAMWKTVPIVASAVGGLELQIRPGVDGHLIRDPMNPEDIADALLQPLLHPRRAESMAREAHSRVRLHFLVLNELAGWLTELERILAARGHDAHAEGEGARMHDSAPAPAQA
jgi:trehalose synthase